MMTKTVLPIRDGVEETRGKRERRMFEFDMVELG